MQRNPREQYAMQYTTLVSVAMTANGVRALILPEDNQNGRYLARVNAYGFRGGDDVMGLALVCGRIAPTDFASPGQFDYLQFGKGAPGRMAAGVIDLFTVTLDYSPRRDYFVRPSHGVWFITRTTMTLWASAEYYFDTMQVGS